MFLPQFQLDCGGRSCKYDYMPVGGGGGDDSLSGHHNNTIISSAMPYHQTNAATKPQVEEGKLDS